MVNRQTNQGKSNSRNFPRQKNTQIIFRLKKGGKISLFFNFFSEYREEKFCFFFTFLIYQSTREDNTNFFTFLGNY